MYPPGSRPHLKLVLMCLRALLCQVGGPCVVVHYCWPTDVSNVVYLALLLQTSHTRWGSAYPVVMVLLSLVKYKKNCLFCSHMDTHKKAVISVWARCTRYIIHRCTYGTINHLDSCSHTQENTHMLSCRHTMPVERLDTLTTPYGPSWPSVPLSTCQAALAESPLPIPPLDQCAAPLQ